MDEKIKKLNLKILKAGPKKGHISNTKTPADFQRNKQMVDLLKSKHTKCMICKIPNFEKISGALYSEASHIIPWVTSHNDSSENIIILCPTCHKKFDEAKITERQKMYKELTDNFPNTKFEKPEWM